MGGKTTDVLEAEIQAEFEHLNSLAPGSEEHSAAVESAVKLYKLKIDETRALSEHHEKMMQLKEARIDRYFRLGTDTAELILPLVCYGIWMRMGFKFEEEGTFTSPTFRNLFSHFRPTKR